jgi:pimeloyl-ACP methyl ester carboxylesterase
MRETELEDFFRNEQIRATVSHYENSKRTIYYATIGEDHLPALLFIHGAPASMTIYKKFFKDAELLKRFAIYAVDRPGYGVTAGQVITSIKKQAEMIFPLAERIHRVHQPLIIVAGSYGASVACRLVMDHPGVAQALALIAPSLGPGLEGWVNRSRILENSFLKRFVSAETRSAAKEKLSHRQELNKMLPHWKKIKIPVLYMQSEKDSVVYPRNASFAKEQMTNTSVRIHFFKGRKHDITTLHESPIGEKIVELYNKL